MDRKRKIIEIDDFLSSSSSSEDEQEYYKMYEHLYNLPQKRAKIMNYVKEVVDEYSDKVFKEHFRVNRETSKVLISSFKNSQYFPKHTWGKKFVMPKHMLSFLWYVGNKCVLRDVADRFGVSISTQYLIISRVLDFFISIAPNVIKFPATEEEKEDLARKFEEISGFPGINGCLDGTYIEIKTPKHKIKSTYVNRHDKTSITLQGICDHERRFLDVFTEIPSKIHDSRVFKLNFIYDRVMNLGNNFHLLGDAAYPLRVNLMTPYRDYGNLTALQKNYNYKFLKTRVKIENTFGLLKGRLRQLIKLENHSVLKISKIIVACCVLSNICIDQKDTYNFGQPQREPRVVLADGNEAPQNAALNKRDEIAARLQ